MTQPERDELREKVELERPVGYANIGIDTVFELLDSDEGFERLAREKRTWFGISQANLRRAEAAEAENTLLRAALAHSDQPCAYCSLPADELAKCTSGFPGCGRADDALGCPELGARMRVDELEAKLAMVREWQGALLKEPEGSAAWNAVWRAREEVLAIIDAGKEIPVAMPEEK